MKERIVLVKAEGEGSRGGKVIAHTRSGKPVYADRVAQHQNYNHFTKEDHEDAASSHYDQAEHASRVFEREDIASGKGDQSSWKAIAKKHVGHAIGHGAAALSIKDVKKSGAKPLGAAFSHARKVAKKNGGGRKKEREVANRYLNKKGHEPMGKAMPQPTFGSYVQALTAQSASTQTPDDHWDMQQYQRLFQINQANTDRLRMEAQMLQMGQAR